MHCVRKVTEDLYWIGANDHRLALFENIHPIPRGVSYNSYVLKDEKNVLFDTVDWSACRQFLENLDYVLGGEKLDYIVINHMEPDHGASLEEVLLRHPEAKIVSTPKAFVMMRQFGFAVDSHEQIQAKEGETLSFGRHVVTFVNAPMVHWPEAMVTFDQTEGILFSADAFGTFGALDGKLFNDEMDFEKDWLEDARRYYRYVPEEKGVLIAYASMYGNTEAAAQALAAKLCEKGVTNVAVYDVSNTHVSQLIAETFRLSHIVLASVTYNMEIYPVMHSYLSDMKGLNVQNRTVAIIENGTWACKSGELMTRFVQEELKGMKVLDEKLTLSSALKEGQADALEALADSLAASVGEA